MGRQGLKIWNPSDLIIQPKNITEQWKNQSWYESPTVLHAVSHYEKTIREKTILVELLLWNSSYREVKIYEVDCIIYKYIYIYQSDETNRTIPPGIFKSIWRVFRKEMFPLMMKKEVLVSIYDILAC